MRPACSLVNGKVARDSKNRFVTPALQDKVSTKKIFSVAFALRLTGQEQNHLVSKLLKHCDYAITADLMN